MTNEDHVLPNVVVAGVHKAGTTSLFTYLTSHPDVYGADIKEIHHFTPIRYGRATAAIEQYAGHFRGKRGEKYVLDVSPSYFYGGTRLIEEMQRVLPEHKVIIMLRSPTDRFLSYYNYLQAKHFQEPVSLEEFFERSLSASSGDILENIYSRSLQEGLYAEYIIEWLDRYGTDCRILYLEDLSAEPEKVMASVADWLGIDSAVFASMEYTRENQTLNVRFARLHKLALFTNHRLERFWRRNRRLKAHIRGAYYWASQARRPDLPDGAMIDRINQFYAEPNRQLKEILTARGRTPPSWLDE